MHLYTQAVGLKSFSSRPAMEMLLKELIKKAIENNKVLYRVEEDPKSGGYYEAEVRTPMLMDSKQFIGGIVIRGLYNPITCDFVKNYYFPYLESNVPYYNIEIMMERQSDKEAYMVHCNGGKKEVAPIFFLNNILEYMIKSQDKKVINDKIVFMSALSNEGKIILPIHKTEAQIEKCKAAAKERSQLMNRAMQGDQEAIDSLTIGDYDILSDICKRIQKEDVYSIVDSSFIPSGLECDSYSIVGNIMDVTEAKNTITGEDIYYMTLECNDVELALGIHKEDLYGEPQIGYRFVGKIWLQGTVFIDE